MSSELPRQHAVLHREHVLAERARDVDTFVGAGAVQLAHGAEVVADDALRQWVHREAEPTAVGDDPLGRRHRPARHRSRSPARRPAPVRRAADRAGSIGDEAPAHRTPTPTRKSPDNATESGAFERRGGVTSLFMAVVGQRVLISGMGGEIGSRVASLLENEPWVESLEGIDGDPPRRRLRRDRLPPYRSRRPRPHRRRRDQVRSARPRAPRGLGAALAGQPRSGPAAHRRRGHVDPRRRGRMPVAGVDRRAQRHRDLRTGARLGHAGPTNRHGSTRRPASGRCSPGSSARPTTIGERIGVAVGALRFAPVIGPHVPSPLGRYLRMPAVPFSAPRRPTVRGRPGDRRGGRVRRRRADPARRTGQRRRSRRDHRVPRHPPRPSCAGAVARSRLGHRPRVSPTSAAPRSPTTCSS